VCGILIGLQLTFAVRSRRLCFCRMNSKPGSWKKKGEECERIKYMCTQRQNAAKLILARRDESLEFAETTNKRSKQFRNPILLFYFHTFSLL